MLGRVWTARALCRRCLQAEQRLLEEQDRVKNYLDQGTEAKLKEVQPIPHTTSHRTEAQHTFTTHIACAMRCYAIPLLSCSALYRTVLYHATLRDAALHCTEVEAMLTMVPPETAARSSHRQHRPRYETWEHSGAEAVDGFSRIAAGCRAGVDRAAHAHARGDAELGHRDDGRSGANR